MVCLVRSVAKYADDFLRTKDSEDLLENYSAITIK